MPILPTKTNPIESNKEQPTHNMAGANNRSSGKISPKPRASDRQRAHEKAKKRHKVNKDEKIVGDDRTQ